MITSETVLVLGAGASADLKFPTGRGLREIIINSLKQPSLGDNLPAMLSQLLRIQAKSDVIRSFVTNFEYALDTSIDRFLEDTKSKEYDIIGRAAIAYHIARAEKRAQNLLTRSGWYGVLFDAITSHGIEHIAKNRLRIITFNYDRSLDQALAQAIVSRFPSNTLMEEKIKAVKSIPIVHVHGQLGYLSFQERGDKYFDFGDSVTVHALKMLSDCIKVVHQGVDSTSELTLAKAWLEQAEFVNFLGFGFDRRNLQRIQFNQENKQVRATAHDLQNNDIERINSLFLQTCGGTQGIRFAGGRIDMFLRNEPWARFEY